MIGLCLLAVISVADAGSLLYRANSYHVAPCNKGAIVENECNRCVCSSSQKFQCSIKTRSDSIKNGRDCNEDGKSSCVPNVVYELNDTVCVCNSSGQWPHAKCNKVFLSLDRKLEINCKPDSYFNSDCNVCKCGADGKLDKARCTKNKCKTKPENNISRRVSNNVYGSCEVSNWYSLAPCQFCFCVNQNKLVCNTGNTYAQKLELGAYNLSVCGKELIREAVELIPENQKALRYGTEKKTIQQQTTAKEKQIIVDHESITVNVNRKESNENKNNENDNEQEEYYTDSDEPKQSELIGREGQSIPISFDNEHPNERKEYEQDFETDNEMGVEIEPPREKVLQEIEVNIPDPIQIINKLPDDFNLGKALKLNLPMVLDKVFQMALRKSMVSVDSDTKCTTGSATILKCNVCFCMKENKLLCTNNECK